MNRPNAGFTQESKWKESLVKAAQQGVFVITCDQAVINYGTISCMPDKDPDDPLSYQRGKYSSPTNVLLVPGANRTIASHHGREVYVYDREGGISWGAPYIAGLAALAYQVNHRIEPEQITALLQQTAIQTDVGLIVNPVGFVEAVRKHL